MLVLVLEGSWLGVALGVEPSGDSGVGGVGLPSGFVGVVPSGPVLVEPSGGGVGVAFGSVLVEVGSPVVEVGSDG